MMPAVKNDAESDGDGDMSGAESERSGISSHPHDRDSSAEDADEPDSDDSSEMDENECERRRNNCLDNLASLEKQFGILREQLYRERMNQVEIQLAEVRDGNSQEYLEPLQRLKLNMQAKHEVADKLKEYRLNNIDHNFDCEMQSAKQNLENEKELAIDQIREEILEKIRKLEEDRHNVDISWSDWASESRPNKVRGPGRKKAVTVTGPYIVYMLKDEDIVEDWRLIRKAIKRTSAPNIST